MMTEPVTKVMCSGSDDGRWLTCNMGGSETKWKMSMFKIVTIRSLGEENKDNRSESREQRAGSREQGAGSRQQTAES